jgi:hypothetical protein
VAARKELVIHRGGAGERRDGGNGAIASSKQETRVSVMLFRSMHCRWVNDVSNVKTKSNLRVRLHGGVMYVSLAP